MDKEKQREQAKLRMRRKRNKEKALQRRLIMPYKEKAMKSRRQKERRKGEAPTKMKPQTLEVPTKVKPLSEAPKVEMVTDQFGTRPRFIQLSDGQVFDRANLPKPTKQLTVREAMSMAMVNRADGRVIDQSKADRFKRWKEDVRLEAFQDKKERERLQSICASLEKHNVLDKEIYYGLRDPCLLSDVNELLTAFEGKD